MMMRSLVRRGSIFGLSLVFGYCAAAAHAQSAPDKPQYGGHLAVGTIHVTISALTWDTADWNWKLNHDQGAYGEMLFAADLSKAKRNGGKYSFYADAWLPTDGMRGELAESWKWLENPTRVEVKLRKGVMFPEKPGVMAARELVADDVVWSYEKLVKSPKALKGYYDHIVKVEALDKHTVLYTLKGYNAEFEFRSGYGHYALIQPKEVATAGAGNWKNHVGSGPFMLTDHVSGNSSTYLKNSIYWDKEKIGAQEYKLPFVDKLTYHTIKDESAQYAALRTAKIDILENIRWSAVDELKKSAPQLQWHRWIATGGTFMAMRTDVKPFDDVRVRRAMNMAVNKAEIVKEFYGGNAELFAYPMHPDFLGYFEPLRPCRTRSRNCMYITRRRPRSCWLRPVIRMASASRYRSAPAVRPIWTWFRWWLPTWKRLG